MRTIHYRLFKRTELFKRWFLSRTTKAGRFIITLGLASLVFGFNTYVTMLYQLAGLLLSLIVLAYPLSRRFKPQISLIRNLPDTCTAGEKLYYTITLTNNGPKELRALTFQEYSTPPLPSIDEFTRTKEEGEEKRNPVDRLLKYYRWTWLVQRKKQLHAPSLSLNNLSTRGHRELESYIIPERRGHLHLKGFTLHRSDPLGLFKKNVKVANETNLLVLPKTYPISKLFFSGSRKYHQGGLLAGAQFGDSQEFVALREYQPGDSIRHIDWKATARVQKPVIRQFQDEYYSRYGIIIDSFTTTEDCPLLEEAISIAASILVQEGRQEDVIDLLFAGDTFVSSTTMGRGLADQHHMLEILASMSPCVTAPFKKLTQLVKSHINLLSGAVLICIDMDEQRKELITLLEEMNIPFKAILVVPTRLQGKEKLEQSDSTGKLILVDLERKSPEIIIT